MNIFLTGATGFLGRYLLRELLARGHRVWALFRDIQRRDRTVAFLYNHGLSRVLDTLQWIEGDILDIDRTWRQWEKENPGLKEVDQLLHSAASLRFTANSAGEPQRSNVGGARALSSLAAIRPLQVHLVSTAYVCGLVTNGVVREVNHPRGNFVNIYEQSKWEAEQIWAGRATILRPGVIVGEYSSGHASSFTGWYMIAKGGYLLDQFLKLNPALDRRRLNIQIPINPGATLNLLPVDYVAAAMVSILENPINHNRIFHLTHANPPTHAFSHQVICRRFELGGIEFIDPGIPLKEPDDPIRKMIWNQTRRMHAYFTNNPVFDREHTNRALPDMTIPPIDEAYINRLLDYAISRDWSHDERGIP